MEHDDMQLKMKMKQTLAMAAIFILFTQVIFTSLPAMATTSPLPLQINMIANGELYAEGEVATSPVEVQVMTTSADVANVEISRDLGKTWNGFDVANALLLEQEGEYNLWFRLDGVIEKRVVTIRKPALQSLQTMNNVIYVNAKSSAGGDGASWATAYNDLQLALTSAQAGQQIWLAEGIYKPTKLIYPGNPRTASFQMKNNVTIYGGFDGTENDLAERDWRINQTILSGDIDHTPNDNSGNAYHVFFHAGLNLDATAILDGVTITGGNANDSSRPHSVGGGMYNLISNPTLKNVIFDANQATFGGGMYSGPGGSLKLTNVIFHKNHATDKGGGIYHEGSSLALINALFYANQAGLGSAVYNEKVSFFPPALGLTNVTMSGNSTTGNEKAAIYGGIVVIHNSIIAGNNNEPALIKHNSSFSLSYNSLLDVKENTDVIAKFHKTKTDIDTDTYTPEDIYFAPNEQDYRLRAKSPAIDKGDVDNYLTFTNELEDLAGNLRQVGIIDLGAYEAFPYSVTYQHNGATGDVPIDKMTYKSGHQASVQSPDSSLVKIRHTFEEWNTQADGDGVPYQPNQLFTITNDVTLYAKWEEDPKYTITYNANDATSGQVPPYHALYEGEVIVIEGNSGNLVRKGYTFVGWSTIQDGSGDIYDEGDQLLIGKANLTLYAKWTPNIYSVTFESNGGSVVKEKQVAYNTKMSELTAPSRQGHTFIGWYKDTALTEEWDVTVDVVTETMILYAKWTMNSPTTGGGGNPITPPVTNDNDDSPPAKVKITLHTNGGTVIEPIDITYNTKVSDLPVPTREGYRFDGWYQDEALTKQWQEETIMRENVSLYAKWTALPVEEPEPPQPSKPIVMFDDLKGHWAKEMIEELAVLGIIRGYEDGTFRPNASISRMHVAVLLTRAFSLEVVREADDFSDVSTTHHYYEAIKTLQQAGIIDGVDGAFLPSENMTRAQLAKVLVGVLGLTPEGTSSFADVDQKHWSTGYIAVLEREGIALGDNGAFNPNKPVTRAQFVAFLYRIMQR